MVVRLYVASTHCRGFRGVVVGVVVSSTQKGLLVGVGVFVSGKIESSKQIGVFLLRLVVHSSIGMKISATTMSGKISRGICQVLKRIFNNRRWAFN